MEDVINTVTGRLFTASLASPCALIAALVVGSPSLGQSYPNKPIRIIEPAGPGSSVDVFARKVAAGLTERLGQPVIVLNRPGANSAIGAKEAAASTPDG